MAEAGDGAAGGGEQATGGAGGAAGDHGAQGGNDAAGSAAGAASALAAAAGAAGGNTGSGAAAGAVDPNAWLPEKHRVFSEDGKTLNLEASARKVAEAYGHAEKRIGTGDVAPATATDYNVTVPEALADKIDGEELAKAPDFMAFMGKMHGLGLTQKQLDGVTAELLERGVKMREGNAVMDSVECTAALKAVDGWKSDTEYNKQMGQAYQAAKAYAGTNFEAILKDYGNDPRICQLLAAVGAELSEDRQASPEAQGQLTESLDTLMTSKAYLNDRDPQHAATMAKVNELQTRVAGSKPVVGGRTMSFNT